MNRLRVTLTETTSPSSINYGAPTYSFTVILPNGWTYNKHLTFWPRQPELVSEFFDELRIEAMDEYEAYLQAMNEEI